MQAVSSQSQPITLAGTIVEMKVISGAGAPSANADDDLQRIRAVILDMGELVERAITSASRALVARDVDACAAIVGGDAKVNDLQRKARDLSLAALLDVAPDEPTLREVMGLVHMASELERMGDHCVNVARIGIALADLPDTGPQTSLMSLADYCAQQLRDMLGALVARDVDRARVVAGRDDRVDRIYHRTLDTLIESMVEDSSNVYRATNLIMVAHALERIADRVTNLAEDLVFLETGVIEELG